jgi:hypothetical protein
MCRRVECSKCGRPTFAGCGAHVEQVLGDVPPAARCRCREERAAERGKNERSKNTPAPAASQGPRSWFKNLLGR